MTEDPSPAGEGWSRLIGAPAEALRQLRGQHLLVVAMGAASLLTLIALFGPAGGRFYAWLLVALVFPLSLLWSLMALLRRRLRGADRLLDNELSAGSLALEDARLNAPRRNRIKVRRRAEIKGLEMNAGGPPAAADRSASTTPDS